MLPFNSSPQFNSLVEPPCITWKAKGCFWILHKIFKGQTSCTIILLGGVKFSLNQVFNFWSEVLYLIFGCPEWTLEIVGFEHWSDSCHWSVEFWDRPFFFLHVHNGFWYISLPSLHDYDVQCPVFMAQTHRFFSPNKKRFLNKFNSRRIHPFFIFLKLFDSNYSRLPITRTF